MILFNEQQIKDIWEMQRSLDEFIRKNNNIGEEVNLIKEKYIALKTEFYEFVNEIESFKYWKKNKGKDHILEEACDTLHFIFSIAVELKMNIKQDEDMFKNINLEDYEINELIIYCDDMMNELIFNNSWEEIHGILTLLSVILHKAGYSVDELYNAYMEKNKVNRERQVNNY